MSDISILKYWLHDVSKYTESRIVKEVRPAEKALADFDLVIVNFHPASAAIACHNDPACTLLCDPRRCRLRQCVDLRRADRDHYLFVAFFERQLTWFNDNLARCRHIDNTADNDFFGNGFCMGFSGHDCVGRCAHR